MLPGFSYARPRTLDEALEALAGGNARIHAGGSDLLGCLHDRVFGADRVVSLGALDALRGIAATSEGGLRIGAMATIADVAASDPVRSRFTALADAASQVASPQLRNQGTLGGNLCQKPRCWYYRGDFHCIRKGGDICFAFDGENQYHCIFGGDACYIVHPSDTAPALAALGAVVRAVRAGSNRTIPVDGLHVPPSVDPQRETVLEPGEILTEVVLPAPVPGTRSSYRKVRERASWDFAIAGVALALTFDGPRVTAARVFLSGAAPVPWRARGVEDAVIGTTLDAATVAAAAEAAVAGAEPLEGNGYKVPLFRGLVAEELEKIGRSR
jgi:xanthine dehydrogenase YagS FAD-binding subunit